MNTKLFTLTLPLLLTSVLASQDAPPTPSPKLKAFERLVGEWVGSGSYTRPETGTQPWSGKIRCEKVLNGFAFKEKTEIDVGVGSPYLFDKYYGIDMATGEALRIGVGNGGDPMKVGSLMWVDSDTLVETNSGFFGEMPFVERTIWSFTDAGYSFKVQTAFGDGPMSTMIEGDFKRADKPLKWSPDGAFAMGQPAPAEMAAVRKLAGDYTTKGWYDMDLPDGNSMKMNLTGVDTITPRFGGNMVEFKTVGRSDMNPDEEYVSIMLVTWDPAKKHYRCVAMDNMGMLTEMQLHRAGEDSFSMHALHPWMGKPMMGRSVMTFGKAGPKVMEGHTMYGADEPKHSFHMEYTPKTN